MVDRYFKLFADVVKQAIKDAESGNMEAISWLLIYGIPTLESMNYKDEAYSARILCKELLVKINENKLQPSYLLLWEVMDND